MNGFVEKPRYVCALGGAMATINALPRAIPILHAAAGCGGNLSFAFNGPSGYLGSGYCGGMALSSSNIFENEIVFGGEERLEQQVEKTLELVDGDLFVILSGCMVEIIGDSVTSVANRFSRQGRPVLGVETGGFRGDSYTGYELVLQTLFRQFVVPENVKKSDLVNLWGIVPAQDPFWKGNLKLLKTLLEKLGLRVNTFFGHGETLDDLKGAAAAALNIVVSPRYGIEAARLFQELHHVPFVSVPFPIGAGASVSFLETVSRTLGIGEQHVRRVIAEEKRIYYGFLERVIDVYNDMDLQRYGLVVGDANYAPALTRFLSDELGWIPELTVVTDLLDAQLRDAVAREFSGFASELAPRLVFDTDTSRVLGHFRAGEDVAVEGDYRDPPAPGFILGSSFEKDLAEALSFPLLTVSYPVTNRVVLDRGYAGFEGGLRLAEDVLSTLVNGR